MSLEERVPIIASIQSNSEPGTEAGNVREIYLNNWLKKLPYSIPKNGKISKGAGGEEKLWAVFSVVDSSQPFLELYTGRERGELRHRYSLRDCLHISPLLLDPAGTEFVVTLANDVIRLAANSREQMAEWMDTMRQRLIELQVLQPRHNVYSREPLKGLPRSPESTRSPSEQQPALPPRREPPPSPPHLEEWAPLYEPLYLPPPPTEEGPPPYSSSRPLGLREAQVLRLRKEIAHAGGVRLLLRKKDCRSGIALVDCFGSTWVAGWRQRDHPLLHSAFHIGDRLLSVGGEAVTSAQQAQRLLEQQPQVVELVVRRVPHGQVFALKKDVEGQDLGLLRDRGTSVIKAVVPGGLADRHHLPPLASTLDGLASTNWVLTEINHRPLNLFFKDNEVEQRLNAVGKDISLLVQPLDLVKALKKQLKSLRSYKDYLVQ